MPEPVASREMYVIARKNSHHSELAAKIAAETSVLFRDAIAPMMVKITPWVAAYLYMAGPNQGDRIPLYDKAADADSGNVFVL